MRFNGKTLNILIYAVLAAVIAFIAMPRGGMLLSHDSLAYLYAAGTFAESGEFTYFGYSTPMIQWPLFMPVFLAVIGIFGENVTLIMSYVNLLLLGITVYICGLLCYKFLQNRLLINLAMLTAASSLYIFIIYYHLWSECFFLLFAMLLIYLTICYIETDRYRYLIGAAISAGLMMWARFTGMELAGLVLIAVFINAKTTKRRFTDAIIYGVIAFLPFCCLLLRNYVLTDMFTGRSKPSITPFSMNIKDTVATFGKYFIPEATGRLLIMVTIVAAFAAAFTLVTFIIKRDVWLGTKIRIIYPLLAVHIVCYTAMAIYSNTFFALDRLSARLYSPIFFICVIALFWAIENYPYVLLGRGTISITRAVVCAAAIAVCIFNVYKTFKLTPSMVGYYSEANLKNDELINYIKTLGPSADNVKIYTNHPGEVLLMTGYEVNYTPRKEGAEIYCLDAYASRFDADKVNYYLWYNDPATNPLLYTPTELGELSGGIEKIADFPAGTIFVFKQNAAK